MPSDVQISNSECDWREKFHYWNIYVFGWVRVCPGRTLVIGSPREGTPQHKPPATTPMQTTKCQPFSIRYDESINVYTRTIQKLILSKGERRQWGYTQYLSWATLFLLLFLPSRIYPCSPFPLGAMVYQNINYRTQFVRFS